MKFIVDEMPYYTDDCPFYEWGTGFCKCNLNYHVHCEYFENSRDSYYCDWLRVTDSEN